MCRWQVDHAMGVMPHRIDLGQLEQMGPGFSLMSPAQMSSSRRCRSGFTTLVTEKTAAFQVHSSVYGQAGFVSLRERP